VDPAQICPGCRRRRDVVLALGANDNCDAFGNQQPGRCLWREQPEPLAPAPVVDPERFARLQAELQDALARVATLEAEGERLRADRDRLEILLRDRPVDVDSGDAPIGEVDEELRRRLDEATALHKEAQGKVELAEEHIARVRSERTTIAAELERVKGLYESARLKLPEALRPPSLLDATAGAADLDGAGKAASQRGVIGRFTDWVAASRMKLGTVSAVLGLLFGGGGVALWHPGSSSGHGSSAGAAPALAPSAAAGPGASPAATADAMQARLQTALQKAGVRGTALVRDRLDAVWIADVSADPRARDLADAIVRAVFAGAGLAEPSIVHKGPGPGASRPVASTVARSGSLPVEAASVPTHRVTAEAHASTTSPAPNGNGASRPQPVPTITAATSFTDTCKERASHVTIVMKSWTTASCMKKLCCQDNHMQADECQAYNKSYPLNCPAS
jgi:hypothetical protein